MSVFYPIGLANDQNEAKHQKSLISAVKLGKHVPFPLTFFIQSRIVNIHCYRAIRRINSSNIAIPGRTILELYLKMSVL